MNITGYKLKSKQALKNEIFWEALIEEKGYHAEKNARCWKRIKQWNNAQIIRLKRINKEKLLNS